MRLRLVLLLLGTACLAALLSQVPLGAQVVTVKEFPQGGQTNNLTASSTGTTGAITATLTGVNGKWTYLCGFVATSGGTTTPLVVNLTVAGTVTATMTYKYVYVSSGQGILGIAFPGCISSSAINTSIVVSLPAGGAGTVNALSAWGYTN